MDGSNPRAVSHGNEHTGRVQKASFTENKGAGCRVTRLPFTARVQRGPSQATRCARVRDSRCWARVPTPWPSPASKSLGTGPSSGSHVLRHSCAYRISFAWQHRSPTGRVVLHLELELKEELLRIAQSIPEPDLHKLPADLAAHHDRYLDGARKTRLLVRQD